MMFVNKQFYYIDKIAYWIVAFLVAISVYAVIGGTTAVVVNHLLPGLKSVFPIIALAMLVPAYYVNNMVRNFMYRY